MSTTTKRKVQFLVKGMDCAEEITTLRAELKDLPGVNDLSFDLMNRKMTVECDPTQTSPERILAAVAGTGLTAEEWVERSESETATDEGRRIRIVTTTASGVCLAIGMALHASQDGMTAMFGSAEGTTVPIAARVAYACAVLAGASFVAPKAWNALMRARPDMNLLMCAAVLGAVAIGEWLEAATVAFLFALSLALEAWSIGRARKAIGALLALSPTKARILSVGSKEELVDAVSVPVGAIVLVRPGEKFPLDGRIVRGRTTVNQAPITGESIPVAKEEGSEVFAGTVNEDGAVEVSTTKPFADSALSQIARMVGEAHSRRSPSEQWVERFARIYTPVVMVAAIVLALIPPLLGGSWGHWFYEALVLLVIACPCALVISTPVSVVAGLVAAARQGVLVKGGVHMETPSRVRAVAFDKTGTLTEGRPVVHLVVPCSGHDQGELLNIVAAIEVNSTHPLARAIVEYAAAMGAAPSPANDFQMLTGKGAHAKISGVEHWVGSHRYLEERGQETPEVHEELERLAAFGASVVVIGREDHVCGYVALKDKLRPNARVVVQALRHAGVEHVVMLTGDNRATGEVIGRDAGVDEIRSELLPQDKVQAIEELVRKYGVVAMVGDGVNDAPALARSSLGIAMGVAGTDAALETADVALMGDDLSHVAWLIRHSRRTLRVIRQNIVSSLAVKGVFLALSLAGHASLWGAIAADTGVSLLVVLNALRLLNPARSSQR